VDSVKKNNNGPMLNAYPDSLGGSLSDIVNFLGKKELKDVFSSFYILPSLFNTDLDRGFSVIDYSLNELYAKREDLEKLEELGIDLKLDFILNHASVLSKQFQDIIKNGEKSKYRDFFIDWNKFWEGCGEMTKEGYIQPRADLIKDMFFRKPGLPILMVRFPDGKEVPYWNTFYQEVRYSNLDAVDIRNITGVQYTIADGLANLLNKGLSEGKSPSNILNESNIYTDKLSDDKKKELCERLESERKYLGQMDLNIKSPLVWEFYDNTLKTLANYGAKIVRLDAFAYAPKGVGEKNFLNEPATWDILTRVRELADKYNVRLLPEIHASYEEKIYEKIANKGYMTYDFFLPGLIIDAFEQQSGEVLKKWADELVEKKIQVVNMLGCHDGIPLLDLKGLISEGRIQSVIDTVVKRGGYVKDLHGQKNVYYQVNATYYSALGDDDKRMLLARAIQIFMPGKPQVWYLDLFAGKNDHEAVKRAGAGGHKEINRTNLTAKEMEDGLQKEIVQKQLELLRLRSTFAVFSNESEFTMKCDESKIFMEWNNNEERAVLKADLADCAFEIFVEKNGEKVYQYK
jgi:sucrose phosphorylase suc13P